MKTQIKKWGDSKVLILSPEFLKFHNAEEGDWIDLSDIIVIGKDAPKQRQLELLKQKFPEAYKWHIENIEKSK